MAAVLAAPSALVTVLAKVLKGLCARSQQGPSAAMLTGERMSTAPEHLMVVCRIYAYSGMGWISQPNQALTVNRCAAVRPCDLRTNLKLDPMEDP